MRLRCRNSQPADRILEATRELKSAITQQHKTTPLDKISAIELLRKVMLGEQDAPLPANSAQKAKETTRAPHALATDDEHERPPPHRSRRILSQRPSVEGDSLHRIVALAAKKTAVVPPLPVEQRKFTRGYASANLNLKLDEWAYDTWFVGAILDENTGDKLEYRDLIKRLKLGGCHRVYLM